MASRSNRQCEAALIERRLRPVYDLLDCGHNKKALQEAEKVLKKWPHSCCARALKGLATLRLGKEREALEQIERLAGEEPTDDSALLVMSVVYRETHRLHLSCRAYEAAVAKEPDNEELHTQLFMAHVRVKDFEAQQKAAQRLYRLKPKNPYYNWAVVSVLLQADDKNDSNKKAVLLQLAERMLYKLVDQQRLDSEQEVDLYLELLQLNGKHSEALRFLDTPLAKKLKPKALPESALPLLNQLRDWPALETTCVSLLSKEPDRWDFYNHLFDSVVQSKDDTAIARCLDLIQSLQSSHPNLRGPRLAKIKLYSLLKDRANVGSIEDLLMDYFKHMGHKPCCASDLKPYIHLIESSNRQNMADEFRKEAGVQNGLLPQSEEQMQKYICSLQLARMCGSKILLLEKPVLNRENSERAPYDPHILLGAHLCYDLAVENCDSKPLVKALNILEKASEESPGDFHCKLLCLRFYHILGCGFGAHSTYEQLNVKHVQLDSMGFAHVAYLGATGLYNLTLSAYETTNKFFAHSYKDSVDHLTFSYKFGSFMKLRELMKWHERLHGSLHRALVLIEKNLLAVVISPSHSQAIKTLSQALIDSPKNLINWDDLRDNRDLGVYVDWDPVNSKDSQDSKKRFVQDMNYVKIKHLLLRCLISSVDVSCLSKSEMEFESKVEKLENYVKDFERQFSNLNADENCENLGGVGSPLPSRLLNFVNSPMPLRETYVKIFSTLLGYSKNEADKLQVLVSESTEALEQCWKSICVALDRNLEDNDRLWSCRKTLEHLVNYIEMLSMCCLIVGLCSDLIKQSNSKKNKKKGGEVLLSEPISNLSSKLASYCVNLSDKLDVWSQDVSDLMNKICLEDSVAENKLKEGHSKAISSLKHVLKEKQKYLTLV